MNRLQTFVLLFLSAWLLTGCGAAQGEQETYGGGRYLWVDAPDEAGRMTIDFNKSYNPPCVLTPYATCPLPTRQNRLAVRIEAGELTYGKGV